MSTQEIQSVSPEIIKSLVLDGDISKMNGTQKVDYYNRFCQSLGLNPLTQPFQIIKFQGKEKLYATKDCTEQLRKIYQVSITEITSQELRGVFVVTAKAVDKNGKMDAATGVVPIDNLKGEALANALMKAETKAKRRVTLSICGLGILDESETDTMGSVQTYPVTETSPILLSESNVKTEAVNQPVTKEDAPKLNAPVTEKQWLNKFTGPDKKELTKEYSGAISKLKAGTTTIEKIRQSFRISKAILEELEAVKPELQNITSDDYSQQ
jgi:hypothetical protein